MAISNLITSKGSYERPSVAAFFGSSNRAANDNVVKKSNLFSAAFVVSLADYLIKLNEELIKPQNSYEGLVKLIDDLVKTIKQFEKDVNVRFKKLNDEIVASQKNIGKLLYFAPSKLPLKDIAPGVITAGKIASTSGIGIPPIVPPVGPPKTTPRPTPGGSTTTPKTEPKTKPGGSPARQRMSSPKLDIKVPGASIKIQLPPEAPPVSSESIKSQMGEPQKASSEGVKKAAARAALSQVAKRVFPNIAEKIVPGLNTAFGLYGAYQDYKQGDYVGMVAKLAIASNLPYVSQTGVYVDFANEMQKALPPDLAKDLDQSDYEAVAKEMLDQFMNSISGVLPKRKQEDSAGATSRLTGRAQRIQQQTPSGSSTNAPPTPTPFEKEDGGEQGQGAPTGAAAEKPTAPDSNGATPRTIPTTPSAPQPVRKPSASSSNNPIVINNNKTNNVGSSSGGETNNVSGQNFPMNARNPILDEFLARQTIAYQ